jgi:hypothetical protein
MAMTWTLTQMMFSKANAGSCRSSVIASLHEPGSAEREVRPLRAWRPGHKKGQS